ncbi:hypothetical protein TNCV_1997851 [Trichonephila clavipes]|uniref:Uncharacterized protein n=1 Tax=Trichonephila clavipes TaxID=2585209 RepID=A0A8X6V785_TRICX|nr:hypothetical protein TNCV_1997851 [Trichonephila clavipes]
MHVWVSGSPKISTAAGSGYVTTTIKRSPYKALFGSEPKIWPQSSHISKELLEKLVTEEDMDLLLNQRDYDITSTPEDLPVIFP